MGNVLQDLRYAFRMLAKSPGFTGVAILTLALGIGANTAIFSVINGVLLRPLAYPQPDRLAILTEQARQFPTMSVSYLNFLDWRSHNQTFQQMAAFRDDVFNLTGSGDPERLRGNMVSSDFFAVLGIKPLIGRVFLPEEDRPGGVPVAVLNESFWKNRYGSDPGLLGKALTLNGKRYTVVGVVASDFRLRGRHDIFVPIGQWDSILIQKREYHPGIFVVGRLKPGVSWQQAREDLAVIGHRLSAQYPDNIGHGINVTPARDFLVGDVRPALWILFGSVVFVLLIACANVANLLLARSTARQKEIAIRAAMGASRWRIVRQLLTESLLLSALGGVVGLGMASWGTDLVISALPRSLPRMEEIGVDGRVLAFTLLASVLTGILFGLAPAIETALADLHYSLKEAGRGSTGRRHRLSNLLVVSETALALVLLAGAGLMIRTIWHLRDVNPGFDPHEVLTLHVALSPSNLASASTVRVALPQLLQRIQSIPGTKAVATTMDLPMSDDFEVPITINGRPRPTSPTDMSWAMLYPVSSDYLRVMSIPLLKGRFFRDRDNEKSQNVVVIDETMARSLFPGEDPIGKLLTIEGPGAEGARQIVGIVGHIKHWGPDNEARASVQYQLYIPYLQIPDFFMKSLARSSTFVLRTSANPLGIVSAVRAQVIGAERDQPVYNVRTMEEIVDGTLARRRFSVLLLGIFGAVALLLAAVGIYGVIWYSVSQRTHEIGIRMALGAGHGDVLKLIVGRGTVLALLGVAIGIGAAFILTRAMSSLLFGVSATDPLTFAAVTLVLLLAALLASYLPARRAARVDPVVALHFE